MQSLSALLLCNDNDACRVADSVFDEYNFTVSHACTPPDAYELIRQNRFDLAVYDHDIPGAVDLVGPDALESSPRVVFVMLQSINGNLVLGKRIHMLLPKPFSANLLTNSLKAAYGTILKEKRAAFRHTVEISPLSIVLIQESAERRLKAAKILNISQSGLCLTTDEMLPQGALLRVEFRIPDSSETVQSVGTIMWAHESGRAGIKFTALLPSHRKKLCMWLDSLLPWDTELRPKTFMAPPIDKPLETQEAR